MGGVLLSAEGMIANILLTDHQVPGGTGQYRSHETYQYCLEHRYENMTGNIG